MVGTYAQQGDLIYGDVGVDSIYGGLGNDTLYGLGGSDYIEGGWGSDVIYAGADPAGTLTSPNDRTTLLAEPMTGADPDATSSEADLVMAVPATTQFSRGRATTPSRPSAAMTPS